MLVACAFHPFHSHLTSFLKVITTFYPPPRAMASSRAGASFWLDSSVCFSPFHSCSFMSLVACVCVIWYIEVCWLLVYNIHTQIHTRTYSLLI